ncbi:MAG: hypothetical protein AAF828_01710 [Bacteroidota bacterium]
MRKLSYFALFAVVLTAILSSCGSSSSDYDGQDWAYTAEALPPTGGLQTTVTETEPGIFKIAEETELPREEDSRIISNYLDGTTDTMTVAEVMHINSTEADTTRRRQSSRAASRGFFYFMMYRNNYSGAHTPRARAYVNNDAYQRANTSSIGKYTAARNSSSRAKSGYGSGRSTRSYGG